MTRNSKEDRPKWYEPIPKPDLAVFLCRRCKSILTNPLKRVIDQKELDQRDKQSLLKTGHYWYFPSDLTHREIRAIIVDFKGSYAVALDDLVNVHDHPDSSRFIGCCGPSGVYGHNRICSCGFEVGTECSDCIYPHAVYLDPQKVLAVSIEDPDWKSHLDNQMSG